MADMSNEHDYLSNLNRSIRVVTAPGWVMLGAVAVAVAGAITWSVAGEIRTTVAGNCLILNGGGLVDVKAPAAGRVSEILVKPGSNVRPGDRIAIIAQPELEEQIRRAKGRLQELQHRKEEVSTLSRRGLALSDEALAQRADFLARQRDLARQRLKIAEDHRITVTQLSTQELVTRRAADDAAREVRAAALTVSELEQQIAGLKRVRTDVQSREREERAASELDFADATREVAALERLRTRNSLVLSAYEGRVIEVKAARGGLITAESTLISIERAGSGPGVLDIALYVPGSEGKKIPEGAEVHVIPASVKKEDHGYLIGKVRRVPDYPSTPESLLNSLGSEDLVRELASIPAPFEIRVALEQAGGRYLWSRDNATPPKLTAGTLCSGNVIVRRERPIGFAIPALKRETRS